MSFGVTDPSDLSGLTAWWTADVGFDYSSILDGRGVGADVSGQRWADQSGNGYHLIQATAGNRPALMYTTPYNGLPGLYFDGGDYLEDNGFTVADLLGTGGIGEVWVVGQCYAGVNDILGLWSANSAYPTGQAIKNNDASWGAKILSYASDTGNTGHTAETFLRSEWAAALNWGLSIQGQPNESLSTGLALLPFVACWHFDGSNDLWVAVNSFKAEAYRSIAVGDTIGNLASSLYLGVLMGGYTKYFKGLMYEVCCFNATHTEVERAKLVQYFSEHWKLWNYTGCEDSSVGLGEVPTTTIEVCIPDYSDGPNWDGNQGTLLSSPPSLWLKADAITGKVNNDPVSAWADSMGFDYWSPQQVNAGLQPLYKTNAVNGLPALYFDGTDDYLTSASGETWQLISGGFGDAGFYSIYVVFKADSGYTGDGGLIANDTDAYPSLLYYGAATPDRIEARDDDGTQRATGAATGVETTVNAWHIACAVHHGPWLGAPTTLYAFEDNPEAAASVTCGDTWTNLAAHTKGRIGHGAGVGFFKGHIAEIIVFPRSHTVIERRLIYSYLCEKYGLTYGGYDRGTGIAWPQWVSVQDDVVAGDGVQMTTGSMDTKLPSRVADSGTLNFSLNNRENNSAALAGYYSPGHTNARTGWDIGCEARLTLDYGGARHRKFHGWVENVEIVPGKAGRNVRVTVGDWMSLAAEMVCTNLSLGSSEKGHELIWSILTGAGSGSKRPASVAVEEAAYSYEYAHLTLRAEATNSAALIARVCSSEMGRWFLVGDGLAGGSGRYDPPGVLTGGAVDQFTVLRDQSWFTHSLIDVDDDDINAMMLQQYNAGALSNHIVAEAHPFEVGSSTVVMFTLQDTPPIAAGETLSLVCPYTDPSEQSVRVAGLNMQTPVATTDYTANTQADGGGTDKTAQLGVSPSFGSTAGFMELTNNDASTIYVTKFQLRGTVLSTKETVAVVSQDTDSEAAYGLRSMRLDSEYLTSVARGQQMTDWILAQTKDPKIRIQSVTINAMRNAKVLMAMLSRNVGDRVSITESTTGLSAESYWIQGMELVITDGPMYTVTWQLTPYT